MLKSVYFNTIETFFDEETIANFKNVTCQTVPLTQVFCVTQISVNSTALKAWGGASVLVICESALHSLLSLSTALIIVVKITILTCSNFLSNLSSWSHCYL